MRSQRESSSDCGPARYISFVNRERHIRVQARPDACPLLRTS
jgi:hypothetical protein